MGTSAEVESPDSSFTVSHTASVANQHGAIQPPCFPSEVISEFSEARKPVLH